MSIPVNSGQIEISINKNMMSVDLVTKTSN